MSQTDSNAFDFRQAEEQYQSINRYRRFQQQAIEWAEDQEQSYKQDCIELDYHPCRWCGSDPCDCEPNDEPSMLTDDDLLED